MRVQLPDRHLCVRLAPITDLKLTLNMPDHPAGWGASLILLLLLRPPPAGLIRELLRSDLSRATAELSWHLEPIRRIAQTRKAAAAASAGSRKRAKHNPSDLLFPGTREPAAAAATRALSGSASIGASQVVIGSPPFACPYPIQHATPAAPTAPTALAVATAPSRVSPTALGVGEPQHTRSLFMPCGTLPGTFAVEDSAAAGPFRKLLTSTFPAPVDVYVAVWRCPTQSPRASDFQWVAWGSCSRDGLAFAVPTHMRASGARFTCAVYHGEPGRTTGVSPDARSPLALELFTCHTPASPLLVAPADESFQLDDSTLQFQSGTARIHRVNVAGADLCVKEFFAESSALARLQQAAIAEYKTQRAVTSDFICRAIRVTLDPPQLVTEWVAGGTLKSALRPKACRSHHPRAAPQSCRHCTAVCNPWERCWMLRDVAEALADLHRVGVSAPSRPPALTARASDRALRHQAGQHYGHGKSGHRDRDDQRLSVRQAHRLWPVLQLPRARALVRPGGQLRHASLRTARCCHGGADQRSAAGAAPQVRRVQLRHRRSGD
jgi:hypothetical protein